MCFVTIFRLETLNLHMYSTPTRHNLGVKKLCFHCHAEKSVGRSENLCFYLSSIYFISIFSLLDVSP